MFSKQELLLCIDSLGLSPFRIHHQHQQYQLAFDRLLSGVWANIDKASKQH